MTAAESPLAGWRILITRPAEQIAAFAQALASTGAVALGYPTISLAPPDSWAPLDEALAHHRDYAWAVFTSPSAVRFTLSRAAAIRPDERVLGQARIAAVGTETARALLAHGLKADIVPPEDDQRQEGLAEALSTLGPGTRVLFPQTVGGRELLRDRLALQGCLVDVVPVSRTIMLPLPDPPPEFDVATFASPSALRAFVAAWRADSLAGKVVAAIGPTTAAAAKELGVRIDVIPPIPSIPALVDALIRHRSAHKLAR